MPTRYTLLNDLARAHSANMLREAKGARSASGSKGLGKFAALLKALLISRA